MKLYIDFTEARKGTRLPESIINRSCTLWGFEHLTGADLLLSPFEDKCPALPEKLTDCQPHKIILRKYCEGGLLIQRKSGGDLLSSVTKLDEIMVRMSEWGTPWLVTTGSFTCGKYGKVKLGNKQTGFGYSALVGALDYWVLRGGGLTMLSGDDQLDAWLKGMATRLGKIKHEQHKIVIANRHKQSVGSIEPGDRSAIVNTFTSFPGIGPIMALEIAGHFGTLGEAVEWVTGGTVRLDGIGPTTHRNIRRYFGLQEGEVLKREKIDVA